MRNVFDAGRYITWASGRGLGPGNGEFFGPCEMASSQYASAIWDPKNFLLDVRHKKTAKNDEEHFRSFQKNCFGF